jgi:uncharacterized RDD family membrane protein YckC
MSAYQYPASAPSYPATTAADPTAVMGRRTVAWVIDALLYLLIMSVLGPTPLSPLAEYYDKDEVPGATCDNLLETDDVVGCLEIGDRAYFTETGDAVIQGLVALAWFLLIYGALQGLKGVTPGKALLGVKVVDEHGRPPGVGRSLLRSILWIVDGAPWCLPLVGFITALVSTGHRRVGDMVAKTFVVGKAHTGPVVVPGLATAATGGYPGAPGAYGAPAQPWGGPPPGAAGGPPPWGAPQPQQQPGAWGAQPSGGFPAAGAPAPGQPPPGSGAGDRRPAPPTSGWVAPGGEPAAPGSGPAPSSGAPGGPSAEPGPTDRPGRGEAPNLGATGPAAAPPSSSRAGRDVSGGPEGTPGTPTRGPDAPAATPSPGAGAGAGGADQPSGPAPGAAAQAAPSSYNPQWDAARGTYIVWEPNRGQWLGWDEGAKEWRPL